MQRRDRPSGSRERPSSPELHQDAPVGIRPEGQGQGIPDPAPPPGVVAAAPVRAGLSCIFKHLCYSVAVPYKGPSLFLCQFKPVLDIGTT